MADTCMHLKSASDTRSHLKSADDFRSHLKSENDLLIRNIGVLATPTGSRAKGGAEQEHVLEKKSTVISIDNGKITYVGNEGNAPKAGRVLDAGGRLVTPGLVDAHTHLVFGGFRQHELAAKLAGVPYMDILRAGGGILSTVEATRAASFNVLYNKAAVFLDDMRAHGTTTVEAKSGYGLHLETEMKQLKVMEKLRQTYNLVPTFMGAHAVPVEYKNNPEGYIEQIIEAMLPVARGLADFCDIFCEKSVFDIKQSRRILQAAKTLGFTLKIHADEIEPMGGAGLAAEMGALSAEHLLAAADTDLTQMAEAGTIAVLLPATSFYLNKKYARARDMVQMGIPVAIASDFNPGSSPNYNMQFVLTLACLKLNLSPKEALTAATLNAAAALQLAGRKGSIEPGKDADIVIWDSPDLEYLFYRYGNNQAHTVIINGVPCAGAHVKHRET